MRLGAGKYQKREDNVGFARCSFLLIVAALCPEVLKDLEEKVFPLWQQLGEEDVPLH